MMSIDNITGKILAEAEEQRNTVLKQAKHESREIIKDAEDKAQIIRNESELKAQDDAELMKNRRISVAELEVRKVRLGAKQAQITECFDTALDRLSNMDEADYIKFLSAAILNIGGTGGELLLNKKDWQNIGEKLVKKVNEVGGVGELTLSKDTINAKGGFVLRRGSMEINSTLETMVNGIRESIIPDVVKALYD